MTTIAQINKLKTGDPVKLKSGEIARVNSPVSNCALYGEPMVRLRTVDPRYWKPSYTRFEFEVV